MKSPLPEEQGPTFEPSTHWCARHLEPFRRNWPHGWAVAMMAIFEECVRRDDIVAAAGARVEMLDRVLREFSPLCCLVGDETTAKWTRLALGPPEPMKAALDELRAA